MLGGCGSGKIIKAAIKLIKYVPGRYFDGLQEGRGLFLRRCDR
jgi:hypothetical protein